MKAWKFVSLICCLVMTLAVFGSPAMADLYNKETIFTFSAPVEIPGNKVLPAGTYVFKLMDSTADRNIVQIFNQDKTQLFATILAIPDYRPQPSEKTIIKFSETTAGGPPAIKEWFYPGDLYGQEFVYPKKRAVELAMASNQSVPSMPNEMTSNITQPAKSSSDASVTAMEKTPVKAEQPSGEEVEVAEVFIIAQPADLAPSKHYVNTDLAAAHELPKTASLLPLILMLGVLLLGVGMLLRSISGCKA